MSMLSTPLIFDSTCRIHTILDLYLHIDVHLLINSPSNCQLLWWLSFDNYGKDVIFWCWSWWLTGRRWVSVNAVSISLALCERMVAKWEIFGACHLVHAADVQQMGFTNFTWGFRGLHCSSPGLCLCRLCCFLHDGLPLWKWAEERNGREFSVLNWLKLAPISHS